MDVWTDLEKLKDTTAAVYEKGHKQRADFFRLVNNMVKMAQTARVGKSYATSDVIRAILKESGIEIVQGTAGYDYKDIPEALKGRPIDDTWRFVK
jgi:cysteinyl-tRNA synthetase